MQEEKEVVPEQMNEEVAEIINQEEEKHEEPKKEEDMEELMKKYYLEELEKSNLKDKALEENMKYMMNMGYLNFRVNYNLLMRNDNDLVISINKLCNNLVTDSIFEAK